jgi:hypothetical protein
MQSVSACLPRSTISPAGATPYDRAARAVTSRREYGRNTSARAAISHRTNGQRRGIQGSGPLLWRANANRDQGRIRSIRHRPAGSAAFAQELRLIARRATISGDQDLVVLALDRAPRDTVRSDHPDARTGRTRRPFFTLRPWRTRRSRGTNRTCIAVGTLRSGWALIALRALAASGQASEQRQCQRQCGRQVRHAHRQFLPEKAAPISLLRRSNCAGWRKTNAPSRRRTGGLGPLCLSCERTVRGPHRIK